MDQISIQDFENRPKYRSFEKLPQLRPAAQKHASIADSIEQDYGDCEEHETSPSGSARHSSGPDEAIFDDIISPTRHSSPQTSHHSDDDDISELPSESRAPSCAPEPQPPSPYTPIKTSSPFRNPSSVRAMQMDITPPYFNSPSSQQRYKFTSPSRNSTPRSVRSRQSCSPSKLSPTKKVKKEYPLVLLHVTLLPISLPYSIEMLESVLPSYMLANWKLLRETVTETVLERGILIPHPKEDYDLLEERLLESLELKIPRILKCGHFHLEPEEEDDILASEGEGYNSDDDDADICEDCGRRVRDGKTGSGTGSRRWDIKIYAANGLMRAGAWGAAWREMERVDVEILPWIDDNLKRELELRKADAEEQSAVVPDEDKVPPSKAENMDEVRWKEIYGENAQPYKIDNLGDEPQVNEAWIPPHQNQQRPRPKQHLSTQDDLPLWTLFRNYLYLAAQDRRNIAILLLSVLVLFLSLGSRSALGTTPSASSTHLNPTPTATITMPATESVVPSSAVLPSSVPSNSLPEEVISDRSMHVPRPEIQIQSSEDLEMMDEYAQ